MTISEWNRIKNKEQTIIIMKTSEIDELRFDNYGYLWATFFVSGNKINKNINLLVKIFFDTYYCIINVFNPINGIDMYEWLNKIVNNPLSKSVNYQWMLQNIQSLYNKFAGEDNLIVLHIVDFKE